MTALQLRIKYNYTYKQIAEELGITVGEARSAVMAERIAEKNK